MICVQEIGSSVIQGILKTVVYGRRNNGVTHRREAQRRVEGIRPLVRRRGHSDVPPPWVRKYNKAARRIVDTRVV